MTCIYLFHELPEDVRRKAAAEMARVCKPGGLVVRSPSFLCRQLSRAIKLL